MDPYFRSNTIKKKEKKRTVFFRQNTAYRKALIGSLSNAVYGSLKKHSIRQNVYKTKYIRSSQRVDQFATLSPDFNEGNLSINDSQNASPPFRKVANAFFLLLNASVRETSSEKNFSTLLKSVRNAIRLQKHSSRTAAGGRGEMSKRVLFFFFPRPFRPLLFPRDE